MKKDFWSKSTVAVIGAGNFGTVLAQIASTNVGQVALFVRDAQMALEINSKKKNEKYVPLLMLSSNVKAYSSFDEIFQLRPDMVIWAIPSQSTRLLAKQIAPYFTGQEILLHATKGIEAGSLKRMTEVLEEEIPCPRFGVISGPNLAAELAKSEPAATVIASSFKEVVEAGQAVLTHPKFRVYGLKDVIGVEWAGTLKNILAIASGCLDALGLGWNTRAMLISRGLAEMVRFGTAMGGEVETFLGLAGVGDLLATCSSSNSRNYRVGVGLAQNKKLDEILKSLGSTAEGVKTAQSVFEFAQKKQIAMPITEGVCKLLKGEVPAAKVLEELMVMPLASDVPT